MVEQQLFQYDSTISGKIPFWLRPIWGARNATKTEGMLLIGNPNSGGMVSQASENCQLGEQSLLCRATAHPFQRHAGDVFWTSAGGNGSQMLPRKVPDFQNWGPKWMVYKGNIPSRNG